MNTITKFACLAIALCSAAQTTTARTPKVYLDAEHKRVYKTSMNRIEKLGWTVVNNKADADFVLNIDVKWIPILGDRKARAFFIHPVSNDTLFTTGKVTTLSSVTFAPRKTVVKRLFRKRIQAVIPMEWEQRT